MMSDKILVFIPAYNCAAQIGRVLAAFEKPETAKYFSEILVLDNGSRDQTVRVAEAAVRKIKNISIKIARNQENYGLGGSHKSAFSYAVAYNFTHIVVLHGDDQGDIGDLLPVLESGVHRQYSCCLGARFMRGSRLQGYSLFRRFGNRVFNIIFSIAAGRKVSDLGSGLNIFTTELIREEFYKTYADNLTFNCYLLLGLSAVKACYKFFPISWREDDQISNVKLFRQAFQTLFIAIGYIIGRERYLQNEHRDKPVQSYAFDILISQDAVQS